MKLSCAILAAALAVVPTHAFANDTADKVAESPKKSKRVCRKVAATGSHLLKTVCMREEQWSQLEKSNAVKTDQTLEARSGSGSQLGSLPQ